MNYAYLLAVIGNRLIALVGLVLLAYLLSPSAFGVYALAATNALLIEIVLGSWIATSANKQISIGGASDGRVVSTLAAAMTGYVALMVLIGAAYVVFPFAGASRTDVLIVLGWSAALMFYDTTLASKNALGQSRAYAALALSRNVIAAILSIALVLLGYGATGAMLGQVAGTLLPTLMTRSSLRIWVAARPRLASAALLRSMFIFGVGGTLSLGFFMLFNAASRNATAWFLGEADAGYLSLATDIFYGPLALLGTSYSLSITPALYVSAERDDPLRQREAISKFFHVMLYLAIPYGVGGMLLAPDIAAAILTSAGHATVASIAAGAAAYSAAMLVLGTLATILLIFNRRPWLIPAVLGTSALNGLLIAIALSQGFDLTVVAWIAAGVMAAASVLLVWLAIAKDFLRLEPAMLLKTGLAAAAMGGAVWLYNRILLPNEPFGAILIGAALYLGLTARMRVVHLNELVPGRYRAPADAAALPSQLD